MLKRILVKGPLLSRSGYGEQSRFALRALRSRPDLYDIYMINTAWGGRARFQILLKKRNGSSKHSLKRPSTLKVEAPLRYLYKSQFQTSLRSYVQLTSVILRASRLPKYHPNGLKRRIPVLIKLLLYQIILSEYLNRQLTTFKMVTAIR